MNISLSGTLEIGLRVPGSPNEKENLRKLQELICQVVRISADKNVGYNLNIKEDVLKGSAKEEDEDHLLGFTFNRYSGRLEAFLLQLPFVLNHLLWLSIAVSGF